MSRTYYIPDDVAVEVDYTVEHGQVFFESAHIDGKELNCRKMYLRITRQEKKRSGLIVHFTDLVRLRDYLQEQLNEDEAEILEEHHDAWLEARAESRRA